MHGNRRWPALKRLLAYVGAYGLDPLHRPRPGTAGWPTLGATASSKGLRSSLKQWTPHDFWMRYRSARGNLGELARDAELADALGVDMETFEELVGSFGRPE